MKDCKRWMWIQQRLLRYALMKDIVVVDIFGKFIIGIIGIVLSSVTLVYCEGYFLGYKILDF
jgi:hypothetical protein